MINIISKKCIIDNCNTTARYNYFNIKIKLYCSKHKLENMIDITKKQCKFDNCLQSTTASSELK